MNESWKLTLPCKRADSDALSVDIPQLATMEPPPVLMTSELEEFGDEWQLEAFFEGKPDDASIDLLISLIPDAARGDEIIEKLPDSDWVTMSQQGLEPFSVGRFYVHSQPDEAQENPALYNLYIEASRAFGTGHHETTAGCLAMLDNLESAGERFGNIADIGTGTGLLSFAALHLWPRASCIASDIDGQAIDVAQYLAKKNSVKAGLKDGELELVVANGTDHTRIQQRAPYDLLIANILAGPLIELAPAFAEIMADGATLILAGLLNDQAENVQNAYATHGLKLAERSENGDWPTLRLIKREGQSKPITAASRRTSQGEGDTGEW